MGSNWAKWQRFLIGGVGLRQGGWHQRQMDLVKVQPRTSHTTKYTTWDPPSPRRYPAKVHAFAAEQYRGSYACYDSHMLMAWVDGWTERNHRVGQAFHQFEAFDRPQLSGVVALSLSHLWLTLQRQSPWV